MEPTTPTADTPAGGRRRPWQRLTQTLSLRIWWAVVATVMVLTLLVGWAWRLAAEPPLREVVVTNAAGELIGSGFHRGGREGSQSVADGHWSRTTPDHTPHSPAMPQAGGPEHPSTDAVRSRPSGGPRFTVTLSDGQVLNIHLPRPPRTPWNRPPFGFVWMLALVAVGVALATYPIVRRLTQRLEGLQRGVERWGEGDLSVRVPVQGHDEIAYLASRFNHAAAQVESLVTAHKSLLANASHELRSPLARLRMGLALQRGDGSPEWQSEIDRNIAELDQLVDEVLLASRLGAQPADVGTLESVDLTGLAAEECARANAELHTPPNTPTLEVRGVSRLLRRLIRNLLDNARRHGQGTVRVYLGVWQGQAMVRVCDNGPGVPEDQRERIFEPFYRLPGTSERDGGVGLGLALVKSVAERHGGRVICENDALHGASFRFTMPLERV